MTFAEQIKEAKSRLPIPRLWRLLQLPGEPRAGANCCCPWRAEKNPSFSIHRDGLLFNDFTEGGGDAITFIERACRLTRGQAMHKLVELAFGGSAPTVVREATPIRMFRPRPKPVLPPMRPGTVDELLALAELRGLDISAVEYADTLGLLRFCEFDGTMCWTVIDSSLVVAQCRRLDGALVRQELKSYTFPGSWASTPVGASLLHAHTNVALVEGGPDLLAAIQFLMIQQVSGVACAMLGASGSISPGAVAEFHRKRVIIFQHNEAPKPVLRDGLWVTPEKSVGQLAAERWRLQLTNVAESVTIHQFAPGIKDLNDLAKVQPGARIMNF